jgi:hypothetical protein
VARDAIRHPLFSGGGRWLRSEGEHEPEVSDGEGSSFGRARPLEHTPPTFVRLCLGFRRPGAGDTALTVP